MSDPTGIVIFAPELPPDPEEVELGDMSERVGEWLHEHVVDPELVSASVREFFANLGAMLRGSEAVDETDYRLEQIEFTLQIGLSGKVGLLGNGVQASGQSGIKFVLKRQT